MNELWTTSIDYISITIFLVYFFINLKFLFKTIIYF